MSEVVELKDWRGTPIEVGSKVVYPSRAGSSMWMSEGEVASIEHIIKLSGGYSLVGVKRKAESKRIAYPDRHRLTVVADREVA